MELTSKFYRTKHMKRFTKEWPSVLRYSLAENVLTFQDYRWKWGSGDLHTYRIFL